jgi:hypothetical protein
MTKLDMSQFKPIPGFDSLKWKAEVHAEILRETEGMTREEVREYFRQAAERDKRWREAYAKADAIAADNS